MIWLLIAWVVFSLVFAEIAPILLTCAGYLLYFIALVLWTAAKTAVRLPVLIIVLPIRAITDALLFVRLLVGEMRSTAADDPHHEDADHSDQHEAPEVEDHDDDDKSFAMRLLGLEAGFSAKELNQAYRQAIAAAHPDSPGGSEDAAKQINAARDLLRPSRRKM